MTGSAPKQVHLYRLTGRWRITFVTSRFIKSSSKRSIHANRTDFDHDSCRAFAVWHARDAIGPGARCGAVCALFHLPQAIERGTSGDAGGGAAGRTPL